MKGKCKMSIPTIAKQCPALHKEAVAMSNVILRSIANRAQTLPDEGMPYKFQCLLEEVIAELEKAV
jgi:hypothetical protein